MNDQEIEGEWKGFYTSSQKIEDEVKTVTIPFFTSIKYAIQEFIGKLEEEGKSESEEDIFIRGRLEENQIYFAKIVSGEPIFAEGQESQEGGLENSTISYFNGEFIEEENKFKGTWELPYFEIDEEEVMIEKTETGEWEMWRAKLI